MVEKFERENIKAVGTTTRVENVARKHGIEIQAMKHDPYAPQRQQVIFAILRSLPDRRVLEETTQRFHFRGVEGGQIPNRLLSTLCEDPPRNAGSFQVGPFLRLPGSRPRRGLPAVDGIAASNETTLLRCIRR
jgi:hypothetical protein